jgi:hypothetical protein
MKSFPVRVAVMLLLAGPCLAQQSFEPAAPLPESPGAVSQAPQLAADEVGTASITGTVVDVQGDPVPEAKVTLYARGKFTERTIAAGQDGGFTFSGLPAGQFRITIAAAGFDLAETKEFILRAGEVFTAPKTALAVASTSTSVDVTASPDQIAIAQVQEQEKQRVLGVFPNFYTSYIWKAEPIPTPVKYKLAVRSLIDPFTFLIVAGTAGAEHFNGTYPAYGPGIQGYGKRYGAAYADAFTAKIIGGAILPSILHQDPRYFYRGSGGVFLRTRHAFASTFVTRGDNGQNQINWSHLGGSLAAGAIANAYHPPASRGLGLTFETFGITTGANLIGNLFREFVFRSLEPSVPTFAHGKK